MGARLGCVLAAVAVLAAAPALGQPATPNAKRLAYQGRKALQAANYTAALKYLSASFALEQSPTVAYNLGLCQRALKQWVEASATFRKFLELRGPKLPAAERKRVEAFIAELERKVPGMKRKAPEMERRPSQLTLDVEPAGASISVDGQRLGAAPLASPPTVSAGRHLVEVALDGYAPVSQTVEVAPGQALMVTIRLQRRAQSGVLILGCSAPGATAVIDGGAVQTLPLSARLAAGEHLVKVVAPNHHPQEQKLTMVDGEVTRLDVVLVPVPEPPRLPEVKTTRPAEQPVPAYRRAWFWVTLTAVAVTAAGAATGGYYGYRARNADSFDRSLRLR